MNRLSHCDMTVSFSTMHGSLFKAHGWETRPGQARARARDLHPTAPSHEAWAMSREPFIMHNRLWIRQLYYLKANCVSSQLPPAPFCSKKRSWRFFRLTINDFALFVCRFIFIKSSACYLLKLALIIIRKWFLISCLVINILIGWLIAFSIIS